MNRAPLRGSRSRAWLKSLSEASIVPGSGVRGQRYVWVPKPVDLAGLGGSLFGCPEWANTLLEFDLSKTHFYLGGLSDKVTDYLLTIRELCSALARMLSCFTFTTSVGVNSRFQMWNLNLR